MFRKLLLLLFVLSLLFLSACSNERETSACTNTLVPIEVELDWNSNDSESTEDVIFQATVTHEGLPVESANKVEFEIWEHGNQDYHHLVEAKKVEPGVYQLSWSFEKEGVYYIYYHVTACDMHRMEKEMVVIGNVDVDNITSSPDDVNLNMGSTNDNKNGHSGH